MEIKKRRNEKMSINKILAAVFLSFMGVAAVAAEYSCDDIPKLKKMLRTPGSSKIVLQSHKAKPARRWIA